MLLTCSALSSCNGHACLHSWSLSFGSHVVIPCSHRQMLPVMGGNRRRRDQIFVLLFLYIRCPGWAACARAVPNKFVLDCKERCHHWLGGQQRSHSKYCLCYDLVLLHANLEALTPEYTITVGASLQGVLKQIITTNYYRVVKRRSKNLWEANHPTVMRLSLPAKTSTQKWFKLRTSSDRYHITVALCYDPTEIYQCSNAWLGLESVWTSSTAPNHLNY